MKIRPIILVFTHSYLPGYKGGGPIRTISNLVDQLGVEYDFWIVTSDRDALDTKPYEEVIPDTWNVRDNTKVFYASPKYLRLRTITSLIKFVAPDIIYLNSFFDPIFTILPLTARKLGAIKKTPVLLAPRGEFSPDALKIRGRRKWLYIFASKIAGLFGGLRWQVSAPHERDDLVSRLGVDLNHVYIAPNLPSISRSSSKFTRRAEGDPIRIIFVSRIAPMKNLDFALTVLASVLCPVRFSIYGPIRDLGYWKECEALIQRLPLNVEVEAHGEVPNDMVADLIASSDLFFLPTRGENFGHAILESLAVGTPVLISDRTPWRHLSEQCVGYDLPLNDVEAFVDCIHTFASADAEKSMIWRSAARLYAENLQKMDGPLDANRKLFEDLLNHQRGSVR